VDQPANSHGPCRVPHVRDLHSEGTAAQLRRWVQPGALRAMRWLVGGGCDGAGVAGSLAPAILLPR